MAGAYDNTTLIQRVKRMESLPKGETAFLDTDILDFLYIELNGTLVPLHQRVNEEFFVKTQDFTFNSNSTATAIEIPSTIGMRLRDVNFTNNPGTGGTPSFSNIPRLAPEVIASLSTSFNNDNTGSGFQSIAGFFIQNNTLEFFPSTLLAGNTVRLKYFAQPAPLCLTAQAGQIIAINGDLVTLNNAPSAFLTNFTVDFIRPNPPFNYVHDSRIATPAYATQAPLVNVSIVSVSGTTYGLPTGTGALLALGDWMSPAGFAPVCQYIPQESYLLLCQAAACRALESLNDREGQQMAIEKYKQMEENYLFLIEPRVQGKPKKFNNVNSVLQASRFTSMRPLN